MRLETWLELKSISQAEFARRIGTTGATVSRIISGQQNISLSLQDAIMKETKGDVTLNDLHAAYIEAQQ